MSGVAAGRQARYDVGARDLDIVVPIYNAPDDARRCIESVLAHTTGRFRLVLIDDASTDAGVARLFDALRARGDGRIALLRNEKNLGFTATANRGMAQSRADVVLLNSDTVVTRGWLAALARCAASDPRIATVTPFSNNAEICSFPRFCEDNPCRTDEEAERVRAALEASAIPSYPDLPTGVGFCMLIRRAAIDALGTFDPAFGAGYGEENDFCLRAARAGWRNVLADDAFVVHAGGRSFKGRKGELGRRNMQLLLARYPHYEAMVRDYVAADPLRPLRDAAAWRMRRDGAKPRVLHLVHDHGGGTEAYVRTLLEASGEGWIHYLAATVGNRWRIEERAENRRPRWFGFERRPDETWAEFVGGVVATFGVSLVHVHHLTQAREGAVSALRSLDVPYGITIHDLWLACPTVTLTRADDRFCGGVTDVTECSRCLREHAAFADVDIAKWRREHAEVLAGAAFLIAPSRWAADMLGLYFPATRGHVDVIPHATLERALSSEERRPHHAVTAVLMPPGVVPTVAVVGAIGPDKGSRRIARLAKRVRDRGAPMRFVVIGYLDVQHTPWQSDDMVVTVHGRYSRADLARLFVHYGARFVLYPSEGPESFSYTLSETWRAGMPALVPPIGALAERMRETHAGWVMTDDEWRDDDRMLDRILALLASDADAIVADAAANARAVRHVTPEAMTKATLAHYARAMTRRTTSGAPALADESRARVFTNERIRDALGYRAWHPPSIPPAATGVAIAAPEGVLHRLARRALAMRRTPMGRLLYRVTPEPVIDALKARLHG
jgi:GT2 family glycosyltransferase/glycosyltransferase involved in cell wall biosynthesis